MKVWLKVTLAVLALGIASIMVSECALIHDGYTRYDPDGCKMYREYDPELGWVTMPGEREAQELAPGEERVDIIWPNGSRASRPDPERMAKKRIMVLGCSYAYGIGVSDENTFAWKLNERFPDLAFDNFAVFGYGTYQCYLREKRLLDNGEKFDLVLYCPFIDHINRNVCNELHIGLLNGTLPYGVNPHVEFVDNRTLRFIPVHVRWPGDDLLVSINFAKRIAFAEAIRRDEETRNKETPEKFAAYALILQLMNETAQSHGARFAVAVLEDEDKANLCSAPTRSFLASKGVDVENSDFEEELPYDFFYASSGHEGKPDGPEFHVGGNILYHPAPICHEAWARKIGDWIESHLKW